MRFQILVAVLLTAAAPAPALCEPRAPRNIILMIADGAGADVLAAARSGGALAVDRGFRATQQSVYPLRPGDVPVAGPAGLAQDPDAAYVPARAWDTTPVAGEVDGYPRAFAGYDWHRRTAPDSANTATAMATGVKTYNNAINVDGNGTPLLSAAEAFARAGRRVGVVTTVQLSDATPAALGGAHGASRARRPELAAEMFGAGVLSVIGGAGNPDWDDNAVPLAPPRYDWIGQPLWDALKAGAPIGAAAARWTLVEDRARIAQIAAGIERPPERLAMVGRARSGFQTYRGPDVLPRGDGEAVLPPRVTAQPTLSELTLAALRLLARERRGLFLVAEGGAVDRAEHANNLARMIEAYGDFDAAVRAVTAFVGTPACGCSWADTLVVVTADHDHLLMGPDAATSPFQRVRPGKRGARPAHRWLSASHSNRLVPLFARGAGAGALLALATRTDAHRNAAGRRLGAGRYLDQTDLGRLLLGWAGATPGPRVDLGAISP